ncbi:hypothetical protein D046_7194A, partial [Vibrio parahaemolyticus V-223/04]
MLQNHHQH